MIVKNRGLTGIVGLALVMILAASAAYSQNPLDEELQKKYAPILGDYEFDLSEFGQANIVLNFQVRNGALWADSGDGAPITLEPKGDESFLFTANDPDSGLLEIRFTKNDQDKYTSCLVALLDMGVEVIGIKIEQKDNL